MLIPYKWDFDACIKEKCQCNKAKMECIYVVLRYNFDYLQMSLPKLFRHSILSQFIQNYFMLGYFVGRITKIQLLKGSQLVFKRCQTCLYFLPYCTASRPLPFHFSAKKILWYPNSLQVDTSIRKSSQGLCKKEG